MTPAQARKMVKTWLNDRGILNWDSLSARTRHFDRDVIFVEVRGWQPCAFDQGKTARIVDDLKQVGRENGFIVSFTGNFVS
jgi:hypothetical protein